MRNPFGLGLRVFTESISSQNLLSFLLKLGGPNTYGGGISSATRGKRGPKSRRQQKHGRLLEM